MVAEHLDNDSQVYVYVKLGTRHIQVERMHLLLKFLYLLLSEDFGALKQLSVT